MLAGPGRFTMARAGKADGVRLRSTGPRDREMGRVVEV